MPRSRPWRSAPSTLVHYRGRADREREAPQARSLFDQNFFNWFAFFRNAFGSFRGLPFFLGSRRIGSSSSAACFLAAGRAPERCKRVSNSPDVMTVLPWALAKLTISWSDETTAQSEPYFSASRFTTASACSPCLE